MATKRLYTIAQGQTEGDDHYYRRFCVVSLVCEEVTGLPGMAAVIAMDSCTEEEAVHRLLAMVFFNGADNIRYGGLKDELATSFVSGDSRYPKTVLQALAMMTERSSSVRGGDKSVAVPNSRSASTAVTTSS